MDTQLVIRAQRGDKGAYGLIATEIAVRFLAVARRILRDIDIAEDATQQALLAIWQHLPQLRDPARFEAWSYRLLVRACYAEGRAERQWTPPFRVVPPIKERASDDDLSSVVDRDELERGFRRLSIDHRTVVVLHHYLDLPLDRVADIVGIPVGTAHSRLHHAMRGLRAALDADSRPPVREEVAQ
ncbi:MAG TPA: sigma-70 family RNA polymerase sigma factor [Candidatus Polarisedimenticolia bacterium]|nr:sigma-70 family RNA polymerase sigma factor [Candidatus Polarisedimenticolia bacterium]